MLSIIMSRMLINTSIHVFIYDNVTFILLRITKLDFIKSRFIEYYFTLFNVVYLLTSWPCLISCYVMLYYIMLYYVMSYQVTTAQEAFQLVAKGNKVRAVGSTQCNDVSSRCVRHFIV